MSTFNARAALFLFAAATLSGCGKPNSSAQIANAAAPDAGKPTLLEPGRWELAVSAERDFVRPFGSAPPADPAREPQPLKMTRTLTVCVTPDLAAAPGPVLITASDGIDRCQRNIWRMKDGAIDGDLTCPSGAGSVPVRVTGNYSRDHFASEATEGSLGLTVQANVEGKRTGPCTAEDRPSWAPRSSSNGG